MSSSSSEEVLTGAFNAFGTAVVTNLIILIVVIAIFLILRAFKSNDYYFTPHYYDSLDKGDEREKLPLLPKSLWGFTSTIAKFPEERILYLRGLDSVMYLRVIKVLFFLFVAYIPLGVGLLIPIDYTGRGGEHGIPGIAMTNIRNGSGRLYAHTAVAFIFTFIALWTLYKTYQGYANARIQWMKDDKAHNYTVMFKGLRQEEIKGVEPRQYFTNICPSKQVVGGAYAARDDLTHQWIHERREALQNLHIANTTNDATGKRPIHRMKPLIGKKVDSITQYDMEVTSFNREISTRYEQFVQNPQYCHVGFATFATVEEAYALVDSSTAANNRLAAVPAPDPEDVYWEKLQRSERASKITKVLSWIITFALIFLWAIPVVFIQGIANLENLSRISAFSWLSGVLNWSPVAKGLIQQFLPSLATILFFAFLPKIIAAIVKFRGVHTYSELSRQVFQIYFLFLLFNVFLVTMWSGGIFSVIGNLANESGWDAVQALGAGVAAQSLFFINYVMVFMLFKYPLNIVRIGDFIMAIIKRRGTATEEQRRAVQRPGEFGFATALGVLVLLFAIGYTYAVLNAFIIPFMAVFFGIVYVVNKYMIIYVYYPKWDSGGLHWPDVFNRIIGSMILSQLVLIIVFILRKSPAAAICAPLPFVTTAFAFWVRYKYNRPTSVLQAGERTNLPANGVQYAQTYQDPIYTAQNEYQETDIEHNRKLDSVVGQKNIGEPSSARM